VAGIINVRVITPADIPGVAGINLRCYREANRGIIPADYLAKMKASSMQREWERKFTQGVSGEPAQERHFVAEDSRAGIVGFASAGPSRDAQLKYEGEIYGVYVLSDYSGRGTGRSLIAASADFLKRRRMNSMLLWVFEGNTKARKFFEHLGGVSVKLKKDVSIDGERLVEIPYAWEDLEALQTNISRSG